MSFWRSIYVLAAQHPLAWIWLDCCLWRLQFFLRVISVSHIQTHSRPGGGTTVEDGLVDFVAVANVSQVYHDKELKRVPVRLK